MSEELLNDDGIDEVDETNLDSGGDVVTDADNPFAWADGLDPNKIQKTWTNYTKDREEFLRKQKDWEDESKPILELRDEIMNNPELQAHLRKFYDGDVDKTANQLDILKNKISELETGFTVKEELSDLKSYVGSEGLPEYDQRELLEYAAKGNYPTLQDAYKSLKFDEIRQSAEERAYDNVKKTRGASIPKIGKGNERENKTFTEKDLATMSDEDFIANYAQISKSMSRGM